MSLPPGNRTVCNEEKKTYFNMEIVYTQAIFRSLVGS